MAENPFADLIPNGGSSGGDASPAPTPFTSYSIPAAVGGADESYDPYTAQGLGVNNIQLTPGVVAVNPSVNPLGTVFLNKDTGEAYIAADRHKNRNPNVVDIYKDPSDYRAESGQANLIPIDQIPLNQIPKSPAELKRFLSNYGKVPKSSAEDQQEQNPFSDLIPGSNQTIPTQANQSVATENPFSDLIPKQSSYGSQMIGGQGSIGPSAVTSSSMPWYENLAKSAAAQTAAGAIQTAGGFERAGAAPVTDISGVNAPFQRGVTTQEATSAFDKAIADRQASLDAIQGIVKKQGFSTAEYGNQINDLQREIGDLQAQKEQTLKLPQYASDTQQQELIQQRQQLGKNASALSEQAAGMFPALGVNQKDTSIAAQLGRGIGGVFGLAPAFVAGPLALPAMVAMGGSQAYGENYDAKVQELKQQGVTDPKQLDEAGHKAGSQAAINQVPALAAYTIGGSLTTAATSALLKGASPLVKGLVGGTAAAGVNLGVSGGLRKAEGGNFLPNVEQAVPDILFGGLHGVGAGLEARAEAKKAADAQLGGTTPEISPSSNPLVNEKEAQITANADQLHETPSPVINLPAATPEELAKSGETPITPAAEAPSPIDNSQKILDLASQQFELNPNSDAYKSIQQQIDELQKPAEAPVAEAQPETPNAVQEQATGEVGVRNAPTVGEGVGRENEAEVPAKEGEEKPKKEEVVAPEFVDQANTVEEVDAWLKKQKERNAFNYRNDPEQKGKRDKGDAMVAAAIKRRITGELTAKEQAAKEKREASNYKGKPVSVDGRNGTIIGNPFGRVKVRFGDGSESTHLPEKIETPVEEKPESKPTEEATQPSEKPKTTEEKSQLELWADNTIQESKKRLNVGLDPEVLSAYAIKGAFKIARGVKDFTAWSKEMLSEFGEAIRPHLEDLWSRANQLHNEEQATKYGPKPPSERETYAKGLAAHLTKVLGREPTQEELSKQVEKKFGKEEAPAPATGMEQQGEMFPQRTTGLKKAVVKEERLARGLEDIPQEERQNEEEKVQRGVNRIMSDPSVAPSIISRIVDDKEPSITSEDAAALLAERNRLMNRRDAFDAVLDDESKSPGERSAAKTELDSIEQQLDRLDRAQRATGSEWGRLGRMYQRMIREDYSLESLEKKERRSLDRPLNEKERTRLKAEAESIEKTSKELDESRKAEQDDREQQDVRAVYEKTIADLRAELAQKPKVEPQIQRLIEKFSSVIKSNAEKSREALKKIKNEGRLNIGLDPEVLYHHAVIGADYILEGATDIAKFTTRMATELGDYVLPHIKDIFAASQKEYDNTGDRVAGKKSTQVKEEVSPKETPSIQTIKARAKADKVANSFLPGFEHLEDELTHKMVYDLARQHILDGVKGEDNVMKAVHRDVKEIFPDATERDVRRAFSEYGKAKFPSKEADRVALAELRTLTRLQESIDRLTEGLPALRTGLQRNKVTQLIREKQAKLNELLKKQKLPPTPEQLASRDAAKQTALKNRIADINKELITGESRKKSPTEPDSPETENLRLEKNAMEQLLKEVRGEAEVKKTPEERYNEMRQKAIKKRMAEIQDRIDKNQYEKLPKRLPPKKFAETQRLEVELKRKQNDFDRRQLQYLEERKPRWQKLLQGTSELAKGIAISGYHSLEKIMGFDLAKLITTPIEEFTGKAVSMIPGMAPKEGALEVGGGTLKGLGAYYKGLIKGAKEAPKVYLHGLSESEELFGKVRPNVARWYDYIGGRLHASLKHIPFTAAEEMHRFRGLANAEKVAPGSTKDPFVRAAIFKAAYEKAQSAKLQEANKVAEAINGYFNRLEQVDPKTGKASLAGNVTSAMIKTFITKAIVKTPANYFKQVMRGTFGAPEGAGRLIRAYWNGIDNITPAEQDAIYKAFKVGGIGFAAGLYGYLDSFKKDEDKVFGGYYQPGRKPNGKDPKWGTIRIMGHTFHYIAHNPVTEIMQFGNTIGRVQQALMKKTDLPTAVATGFGKAMVALLGNAPISGPAMRLGQPNFNPVDFVTSSLQIPLLANLAQDTDEGVTRKATTLAEKFKMGIPGLRQTVPIKTPSTGGRSSGGFGSSGFGSKGFGSGGF